MTPSTTKAFLRKQVLARRDGMACEQRIENSISAAQFGADEILFEPGCIISGFFPIRSEIDPRPLMDKLRVRGAQLCLPVLKDTTTIVFRQLVRGDDLIDTGFGTRGPGPQARELDPQIMLMPLAVFDNFGGRIGYGAGHYDRAISRLISSNAKPRLIGVAFDCQRHQPVPQEAHDIALDAIVTESGYRELNVKGSQ